MYSVSGRPGQILYSSIFAWYEDAKRVRHVVDLSTSDNRPSPAKRDLLVSEKHMILLEGKGTAFGIVDKADREHEW